MRCFVGKGERIAQLEDVCTKASSSLTLKDLRGRRGIYPVYGAGGLIENVDFYQQEAPYIAVVKDGAGVGRVMKLPGQSSVIGTMQYILPGDTVNIDYLAFAMEHMDLGRYHTGATIPHIYFKDYKKEVLPLPPLERQMEIASVLTRIVSLASLRKRQLEKLDELVKVRFVELFGDPVQNPRGWDTPALSECLLNIENGKSFPCGAEPRKNGWPAVLRLSAVTYGSYQPWENKAVLDKLDFVREAEVRAGDLLFTRKNTPELVGMSTYVFESPPNLMMPDLMFRLNTNERCDRLFLWQLINHNLFRSSVSSLASGSAKSMSNISKERLYGLRIICPPTELQRQFASFVQKMNEQGKTIQKSLAQLETLKRSLMQTFFF